MNDLLVVVWLLLFAAPVAGVFIFVVRSALSERDARNKAWEEYEKARLEYIRRLRND